MDLNKLVHQSTRLQIFAYLYTHGETSFSELVDELDQTEGNMSSHLQQMEEADAVDVKKEFVERKPRTSYELTDEGERMFEEHIESLETILDQLD
jgi:DNA-binding MarR family transcriptional regulator